MRKAMFRVFLPLATLAGCSSPEEMARETGVEPPGSGESAGAGSGSDADGVEADLSIENETLTFAYGWSKEAQAEPRLRNQLAALRSTALDQMKADTAEAQQSALASDYPYRAHSLTVQWKTVGNTPRYLSLATEISAYSGGAHGNTGHDALVWDRSELQSFDPVTMFRSPIALENAVGSRFCPALDAARAQRRGAVADEGTFGDCPPIDDLTVLLMSSDANRFDALQLVAAPYVAGPYAEGTYEVTVTVDPQVLDALKPEYRDAFGIPG